MRRRHQGGLTLIAVPSLDRWTENQRMKDAGGALAGAFTFAHGEAEYALDTDGDGTIGAGEFPIHDVTAVDPTAIEGGQISVLTRSEEEDPTNLGSRMPPAANHVAGAPDNFMRRRSMASAAPRNL